MRKAIFFVAIFIVIASTKSYSITITGNDEIDIHGYEFLVSTYDQAILTAHSGSELGWVSAYDYSTININGAEITRLTASENATINLNAASVSNIYGYDNSLVNISGGAYSYLDVFENNVTNISYLDELGWLRVNDESVVNIYGSEFQYSNGILSGLWSNGDLFSFWAVQGGSPYGNEVLPGNIILHTVSEPSSLAILLLGLSVLISRKILTKRSTGLASGSHG